jgi:bacteriorhodopsin
MVMFAMRDDQFQLVYNVLSFSLASMMATTLFLWMRVPAIVPKYQSAVLISGLVTFIAAYHYMRIFNSWVAAYEYPSANAGATWPNGAGAYPDPHLTGVPFNDAYRYMDWLLTVPLLLIEIVLTMKMSPEETASQGTQLGVAAALMICAGYPGELIVEGDLSTRWQYWGFAMVFFLFIVYTLLVGLADATNREDDPTIKALIQRAQWVTVVSWLTYPVVYLFPMFGFAGAQAVVAIQCGYCASDIISKCGVGLIIYQITSAKSANEMKYAMSKFAEGKGALGTAGMV